MPIDARESFAIFKRSAAYEFAKTRHDYETGDAATVERAVEFVAKRLEVSPAEAKQILVDDGWTSRFDPPRSQQERSLMEQSSSTGARVDQGASVPAGETANRLGGLRDWKP